MKNEKMVIVRNHCGSPRHEDGIHRMIAILRLCMDEHRPDIIQQVIELGEWALEEGGE